MESPEPGQLVLLVDSPTPAAGVWGVRNYHTTLEQRAGAGAAMTGGYLAMALAASAMATAGLLLDSAAAVIGSMCVAPFMAPSRAVCIGALFRDWGVFGRGLVKQVLGLVVVGTGMAMLLTAALNHGVGGLEVTHEIAIRAMPNARDVVLSAIVAVAAGAAASLALVTQPHIVESPWGQVVDAVIGVEIAISLVPPAAVVGIGLALGKPEYSVNALYLLLLNVVCLDLVGSIAILAIRGIRRRHLELEKRIRASVSATLGAVPGFIAVGSTVDVALLGESEARVDVICRRLFGGAVPATLATKIADELAQATSCRCHVSVQVIPMMVHSTAP